MNQVSLNPKINRDFFKKARTSKKKKVCQVAATAREVIRFTSQMGIVFDSRSPKERPRKKRKEGENKRKGEREGEKKVEASLSFYSGKVRHYGEPFRNRCPINTVKFDKKKGGKKSRSERARKNPGLIIRVWRIEIKRALLKIICIEFFLSRIKVLIHRQ